MKGWAYMSYEEIKELVKNEKMPIFATNENGENVIIEQGRTADDIHYFQLTTIQENDWCRINCYYADGTIDETYDR